MSQRLHLRRVRLQQLTLVTSFWGVCTRERRKWIWFWFINKYSVLTMEFLVSNFQTLYNYVSISNFSGIPKIYGSSNTISHSFQCYSMNLWIFISKHMVIFVLWPILRQKSIFGEITSIGAQLTKAASGPTGQSHICNFQHDIIFQYAFEWT